ncbi:MAG: hypothetical protein ACRDP6_14670 [Actinoallomurus sp.]
MADRTVSVRLRAQIGDFVAEFNLAGSVVDSFGKKVDGTSKKVQDSNKKTEQSVKQTSQSVKKSSVSTGSWIASLVGAAAGVAAPFVAAGVAAGAFAAVAAPSIVKVVKAQADLNAGWSTLDSRQRATSANLNGVISQYKGLAKSYEPQALSTFNGLLGDTSVLMKRAKPLLDAGAQGVQAFTGHIDDFVTGGSMHRFLDFEATQAGPTLDKLGQTFGETGTLALNLVHDLTPMGQTLLSSANGGLRLLTMVEQINPHLVEMGATALALRAPTAALANLWDKGATKVSNWGTKTSEAETKAGKLAKGAGKAEGELGKLNKTVGSSPNLWIGAALAVGYVVTRMATAKDSTDNLITALRTENNAIGNNIQGHQGMADSLTGYIAKAQEAKKVALDSPAVRQHPEAVLTKYNSEIGRLTEARKAELAAVRNIDAGESDLADTYGVSATQANQLATAAGVDLSKGITGSGDAAKAAQAKIRAYFAAVQQAANPTFQVSNALDQASNKALDLKTRMTALSNAFGVLAGPELQAMDATTKTAAAFDQFDAAMKKSKGSMSLTTVAGQNAKAAFVQLLATVNANIDAQYAYDSATQGAAKAAANRTASARSMLPVLLAEAGANKQARNAILDWANSAGVGKTRADAMAAAVGRSKSAFIAAAREAGKTKGEAEKLWAAFNKLPATKNTKINSNAAARRKEVENYQAKLDSLHGKNVHIGDNAPSAAGRINRVQAAINALHDRTVTLTTRHIIETIEIAHRTQQAENARADGGIDRYAAGGVRRDLPPMVVARPTVLFGETSTGGEAFIPLGQQKRKRSVMLLSDVASMFGLAVMKPATAMADGGIMSFADGGTTTDIGLSSILSDWASAVKPSTKAQLDAAAKARRTQVNQLASAEDALARARKKGSSRDIAAAERRIATERSDLASATSKLADVEARYQFTKQAPAKQLGSALSLDIKAKAAFIKNLTTLTDKGYGPLAQQLLAMGDSQAEKIAADAVKLSSSKLATLNTQVTQSQAQATQLANLPAILTAHTAIKAGQGTSWVGLLNATGLTPDVLAIAVKSMLTDLAKTPSGQALVADMHAHGYAHGGPIVGRPGIDTNLIRATAGEYMVRQGPAQRYRPWVEAINQDRLGEFVRHLVSGGSGGRAAPASTQAPAGPTIQQTFQTQDMDVHQLAHESARLAAWELSA